ncbi:MAG TPA: N-acetylmuramoyl-L-alanine amidase-like domain-containing protein [Bacteroidales bacterium]
MRSLWMILVSLVLLGEVSAQCIDKEILYEKEDSLIIQSYLQQFSDSTNKTTGTLIAETGLFLLNTPYVASTLEGHSPEKLVVNLRSFDCTTFLESVMALTLTLKQQGDFEDYCHNLEFVRYRDGKRDGYLSRLHYFSEWILNNQKKGLVRDVTKEMNGEEIYFDLNFMSTHYQAYEALAANAAWIPSIEETEECVRSTPFYYLPKAEVNKQSGMIENGDLIAITTAIEGLDISHVGIAYKKGGVVKLMNASLTEKKVVVSTMTLADYLASNKKQTGIIVLRMIGELPCIK